MLVVPCSMKTIAGIASGYSDNLLLRAADVTLKEQRPLVLAARETPLSPIHLRNMAQLATIPGVQIIPPMLTYYMHPESIRDIEHHLAAKMLGRFGIDVPDFKAWGEAPED
jgi:4-hydroxy-3-polyprenylbenzoate decarboxylase